MTRQARQPLGSAEPPVAFVVTDARSIPLADASVDVVLANHMLYHGPNRPGAFAEIRRVLRPGGLVRAATIGTNHLRELD